MSVQALAIRPYHSTDEAAIIQLWRDCGLTRPWNDPRKDIARKLTVQSDLFLVGVADGEIVATLMGGYDGHRAWINYLAVSPAHQRRGHATTLMRAVERKLLEMGCPKINLLIRSGNAAVQGFYESLGFQQDEVISMGKRLIPDL
ncbi:GNAT family acetyltransferase [Achromobacter anxifer]|jgi:ribosomal protein S18 acetylase RimI-like enzyme|uniref:Acetyltransferase YpeA n=1 Tax=Achromobacter anxifer TaxID=1287737 RepID=A0A6S7CVE1_9BURK|nr:GNAT family acetyltransferase [Achromobacter anxifer]MDF8365397.1 GNAT family acetyltransferase [Achromobacter anxifer]CAB3864020.1 Acetyltransferase YpeA [Achromobacter anxifer]CAB5516854.1 Acetyltransferase YpeA [Achromobacter anxifer]